MDVMDDGDCLHAEGLCCKKSKLTIKKKGCKVALDIIQSFVEKKPQEADIYKRSYWNDVISDETYNSARRKNRVDRAVLMMKTNQRARNILLKYCAVKSKGTLIKLSNWSLLKLNS